ncbi:hypothetical protein V490_02445 [Pseudogymnoascus sp. VKM F-3557]|nr:hypothetical protein V490_02445 [Pseudogymnoascus sp. VKM F-3557]
MPSWPGAGGVGGTPTTAQYCTVRRQVQHVHSVATAWLRCFYHTLTRHHATSVPLIALFQNSYTPPTPPVHPNPHTHAFTLQPRGSPQHSTAHHSAETGRYERHEDRAPGPSPASRTTVPTSSSSAATIP